jgi:hypothetical protein
MPSPNLDIAHVAAAQNQKEVTINDAIDALDRAVTDLLTKDLTAETSPLALTATEALRSVALRFTGTPAGAFTIHVPASRKGWHVLNDTTVVVTVKTPAGAGVDVAPGGRAILYCDGADVVLVADSTAVGAPYDVGGSVGGQPDAGETILRYPFPRAVSFAAGLPGSRGVAGTAPAADATLDLRRNAVSFGTMTFAAASTTATFAVPSEVSFAAGDVLTVVAPTPQDSALADLGFSFAGTRS